MRRVTCMEDPVSLGGVRPRKAEYVVARQLMAVLRMSPHEPWIDEVLGLVVAGHVGTAATLFSRSGRSAQHLPSVTTRDGRVLPEPVEIRAHHAAALLWLVMQSPVVLRIKRCAVCQSLFVDEGRGRRAKYCSATCGSREGMRKWRLRTMERREVER